MDKEQIHGFTKLIQSMYAAFGRQFDKNAVVGWMMGLEGLTEEEIRFGVKTATQICTELPSPRKVRELASERANDSAADAWNAALKAVSAIGYMRPICFRDGAVNATVLEMGGWPKFCGLFEREAEVWIQKRFCEIFERNCLEGGTCGVLRGASELERKPRLIDMRAPQARDMKRQNLIEHDVPSIEEQTGYRMRRTSKRSGEREAEEPSRPFLTAQGAADVVRERLKSEATPEEIERRKASVLRALASNT